MSNSLPYFFYRSAVKRIHASDCEDADKFALHSWPWYKHRKCKKLRWHIVPLTYKGREITVFIFAAFYSRNDLRQLKSLCRKTFSTGGLVSSALPVVRAVYGQYVWLVLGIGYGWTAPVYFRGFWKAWLISYSHCIDSSTRFKLLESRIFGLWLIFFQAYLNVNSWCSNFCHSWRSVAFLWLRGEVKLWAFGDMQFPVSGLPFQLSCISCARE